MLHNPRSTQNRRSNDREQERGDNDIRSNGMSNQHMRPRDEEDVHRGRGGRVVEWTSRLLAIDYDRNAE